MTATAASGAAAAHDRRLRVHVHSDSPFFSGSENMLVTLFGDPDLREAVEYTFSFRADPGYEAGFLARVPDPPSYAALDLPTIVDTAAALPGPARPLARALMHATGSKGRRLAHDRRVLRDHIAAIGPDVVHVNSGGWPGAYSCPAAALAAKDAGAGATLFVANNLAQDRSAPQRWFDAAMDREASAAVDAFVTGSRFAAASLAGVLGVPEARVRTIPNGIRPRAAALPRADALAALGVPADAPVVLVVANLEPRKGQRHLLRAAALAPLSDARFTLLVEGAGPDEGALRELAVSLGLGERVRFVGRVADVWSLMAASDVMVLPSVANEDFPNVVLEAMSLGKPVVASRIAGTPEQVVDGETGSLVEPGDEPALSGAVARLVADEDLRRRMGEAGRARFEERFTAGRAAGAYLALYRELAAGAVGAPPSR